MSREGRKGCLVIHGLTGTPETMKPLTDDLIEAGFKVDAPLLPGHGTSIKDLARVSFLDWWDSVLNAYHSLKKEADSISVVGLSLGSLLALRLAIEVGMDLRAVVAMGTPIVLDPMVERYAYPCVKYTPARWFYRYQKKDWEKSVRDLEGRQFYKDHSYHKISIHSVLEIFKLKAQVRRRLKEILSPVFVIHGKGDLVAPITNVDILKKSLNSHLSDILILDNSRHVVTLDKDKKVAAERTIAFLDHFS